MRHGFSNKILVSITGSKDKDWEDKLRDIDKFRISKIALFLECFELSQRRKIYKALLKSTVKEIPLVHIKNDMKKGELDFLAKNFKSRYFTIHENSFEFLDKWQGFHKRLFLEMNKDNFIAQSVKVNKIGGFCIDLAHFKAASYDHTNEFKYIIRRRRVHHYFACNHLNGYNPEKNSDMHTVKSLKDFDYLKTLPKFLFGKAIGLETKNSISEQLKFKKYLTKMLSQISKQK